MNHRASEVKFKYAFDPHNVDSECVSLPDGITVDRDGITVEGCALDYLGSIMFKAHVTVSYATVCARCAEDIKAVLEFDMERMILTNRFYDEKAHVFDDDEWDGECEDVLYVNEGKIIPDADVMEEISLNLPPYDLCSEDCPGLCPRCGNRLKDGACNCKEEKDINPKLAILQKLLDNQK